MWSYWPLNHQLITDGWDPEEVWIEDAILAPARCYNSPTSQCNYSLPWKNVLAPLPSLYSENPWSLESGSCSAPFYPLNSSWSSLNHTIWTFRNPIFQVRWSPHNMAQHSATYAVQYPKFFGKTSQPSSTMISEQTSTTSLVNFLFHWTICN